MPELPEVETVRTTLDNSLPGLWIAAASSDGSPRFADAAQVRGARLGRALRRGKWLMLELERTAEPGEAAPAPDLLVVHLGMSGALVLADREPPVARHERGRWELAPSPHAAATRWLTLTDPRGFGRVSLALEGDVSALAGLVGLGLEPLSPEFTPTVLATEFAGRSAPVKALLLDQSSSPCGLGNIYVDEALWIARIHPLTPARSISKVKLNRLHAAVVEVIECGVANRGTTLRDYKTAEGGSGENQNHLSAYGRAGKPCLRCSTQMRTLRVAGRNSVYCPRCQRITLTN